MDTVTASDVASPEPSALPAVIRHATVRPRSAAVSVYVGDVAPAMTVPLRSQAYVNDVGWLVKPPLMHASCSPTTGVPSSDGGATATGDAGAVVPAITLTYRSRVDLLPALSNASAVSFTTPPIFEVGGV